MKYYQIDGNDVVSLLKSDAQNGLSERDIINRRRCYGTNILPGVKPRSLLSIFISQFENPLIYLLVGAAIIIFIFSPDKLDAFIISGVLFFNAIIGTIQEVRTKNIVESLKRFLKTDSIVLRDGKKQLVTTNQP